MYTALHSGTMQFNLRCLCKLGQLL